MISGVPLFRGRDNQDQLLHIMRIIGTPSDATLKKISTDSVNTFIDALPDSLLTTELSFSLK
jgi:negative regulator of PHO system